MRTVCVCVLAVVAIVPCTSLATLVEVDYVVVTNGGVPVYGDLFDNGVLDPPWTIASGSPGPESGTTLKMDALPLVGDFIVAPMLGIDPQLDTTIDMVLYLTDFPDYIYASLAMFGAQSAEESLWLTVTRGAAVLTDGMAAELDRIVFFPGSAVNMAITSRADGTGMAVVNGQTVFDGPVDLGQVSGVGVLVGVVPEPVSAAIFGMGAGVGFLNAARRRRFWK